MLTQRAPPQVKALLFGLPNSTLKLHMRRQDGSSCDVIAMRQALTKKKCCLLVLNLVTSPPRWIRQPQLRAMHGLCVFPPLFFCSFEASHPADVSAPVFSGSSAFSLRLTPSRLTPGATSALQSPPRFHLCPSSPFGHVRFTSPLHPGFYYTER